MKTMIRCSALMIVAALWAVTAQAQTADEVVEKHLTALGGRAALGKLESRWAAGSIIVSTQGMDLAGSVEIYAKAPNKTRSYIRLDLSAVGGTEMIIDQRCDGKTAFASNSMQGDREITGSQLQNMLNGSFPTPLLKYKDAGTKVELAGKEKVGMRDAFVLKYTPKVGPASKQYFDAETYLLIRTVITLDAPEMGGAMEQTTDLSDYREVDGVKMAFSIQTVNSAQTVTIRLEKVEQNKPLDDAMFVRAVAK